MSEATADLAALVTTLRARLEQQLADILIIYADEPAEELTLLKNLTNALTQKVAPARLLSAAHYSEEATARLIVTTTSALSQKPELARHQPFELGEIDQYIQQPALRKTLWEQLKSAL